ncbi:phospholipid scramblase-related protein [Actinomadura sp. NPDC047616]|uniref:phospholipid scramblase-related protein n=1 Tax=Actinomadura sp. NPDC047616 TaxID=3155914 RepID=UPI0033F2DD6D
MTDAFGAMRHVYGLFGASILRVEQPRRLPAAKSQYRIFDGPGTLVAEAEEENVSIRRQASRVLWGGSEASARTVRVSDPQGVPLMVIDKPVHSQNATVYDPDGAFVGVFQQEDHTFRYGLHDVAGRRVGELKGNRLGRRFAVLDAHGAHVAQVDKKWAGVGKEVLTTADRYTVEIYRSLPYPLRHLVVAAALAMDMIHYEEKDYFN